ncbi:hypothetical protein [Lysinibacillus boronitolerans]|uniref:Uncharacterized protein n=1 Tax=Lysinibacillus boronitolerans JCM 21713 = 10a = NBRC 103108 TaxID=1294264 RepID=A0ABR4Y3X7_9BACI|nr:hypothetical protein [Lysinibacillus boronitolerans]KGR88743.1 hypothetical protein CD31_02640 [Lysinibacillus boronitolerans JCM 21713 = 10a = NBRC 103108]
MNTPSNEKKSAEDFENKIAESFVTSDKVFYFAKINIHGNIFKPNLDELIHTEIPRVIEAAKDIKLKHSTISFTDIIRKEINNRTVIIGHLTNSKKEKLRFKSGSNTFVSNTDNEVANSAMFIYDLGSEILSFTTTTKIGVDQFIKHFTSLLSQDEVVGEVVIKLIPEEYDIIEEIKAIDKITFLKFSLIHPNPGKRHYNMYQKMVKETSSKEMEISFKDEKDGLKIKNEKETIENETVNDGIEMVQSGYGEIEVRGENISYVDSGKKRKTKKRIVKRKKFNSKNSNKKLSVKDSSSSKAFEKVVDFIIKNLL